MKKLFTFCSTAVSFVLQFSFIKDLINIACRKKMYNFSERNSFKPEAAMQVYNNFSSSKTAVLKMLFIKRLLPACLALMATFGALQAQTTVFSDDFQGITANLPSTAGSPATFTTGSTPSMTYTVAANGLNPTVSVITVSTTKVLSINNGASSATKNANWVTGPLSSFASPFNATLASNSGLVTWSFNVNTNNNSTGIFGTGGFYAPAVILAASSASLLTAGTGYAVVSTTSSRYDLVRYSTGLSGTVTTIITGTAGNSNSSYRSIRVTYDPATGGWSLYVRDDGSTVPADPSVYYAAAFVQQGSTTVDNTYTGSALSVFGYLWNHNNSTNKFANFDNFKCAVVPAGPVATAATSVSSSGFTANWNSVSGATGYKLDVATSSTVSTNTTLAEGFATGATAPAGWTFTNIGGTYTSAGNFGIASPSVMMDATNDQVQTISLNGFARQLSFWIKGQSLSGAASLLVEGFDGTSWSTIDNITTLTNVASQVMYNGNTSVQLAPKYFQFRFTFTKATGNLAFDDVNIIYQATPNAVAGYNNLSVAGTSQAVTGLSPSTNYYYQVRAVFPNNASANSNTITAATTGAVTPDIALADNSGGQVAAGTITANTTSNIIYNFQAAVTTTSATLNSVSFATTNNAADVTNYKLYYSATNSFGSASQIGSAINTLTGTGTHAFSGLTQSISSGATGYFWIVSDVPSGATPGNTITVSAITTADITFASGNKTGSTSAGGTQTIVKIPAVTTSAASNISTTDADLAGTVNANGSATATSFDWGTTTGYGNNVAATPTGFATITPTAVSKTSFSSGTLIPNTLYHFTAKGISAVGSSVADDKTFTTFPNPPSISSGNNSSAAASAGGTSFTAFWTAPAGQGSATFTYSIEVDDDNGFGTPEFTQSGINSATTNINVTSGLISGGTYFYRVKAVNVSGTQSSSWSSPVSDAVVLSSLATEPAAQGNITFGTFTNTSIVVNFSSGDGAKRVVVARLGTDPSANGGNPSDGTTYTGNATFGSGTEIGSGNFVVYAGTGNTVTVTGLSATSAYYFAVYEYNDNNTAGQENYLITSPGTNNQLTLTNAPVATATTLNTDVSFSANWGAVTGATSYRLDVATDIGFANFVSGYSDLDVSNVTTYGVTGLSGNTPYYYRVRAVNAAGSSASSNIITTGTVSAEPTVQAGNVTFSSVNLSGFTINFDAGDGTDRIVLVRSGSAVSADPTDGITYSANAAFTSGSQIGTGNYVVYKGSGNSVAVTGLTPGVTYHIAVYEFNGSGGSENYLTTGPAIGNQATNSTGYRSFASGNWNDNTKWEVFNGVTWVGAGVAPSFTDADITILNGHTITINTGTVTADELTINSGGQLTVSSGATLILNDGLGTDLTVVGYLKNNGTVTNNGQMVVGDGTAVAPQATYEHNVNGGTVPTATWTTNSTCLVTGITSSTAANGFSQNFYHFVWNNTGQTANLNLGMFNNTINGNFSFLAAGTTAATTETALTNSNAGTGANTITINGNLILNAGAANIFGGHRSGSAGTVTSLTINVLGNFNLTSANLKLQLNGGITNSTWNVYGNFSFAAGTFQSTNAASFHFANSTAHTYTKTGGTYTTANATMVVDAGSSLDAGTSLIDGTVLFTLNNGCTLTTANTSATLTTTGTKTLGATANYVFNGSSAQTLPAAIVAANNITVNNSAGIILGAGVAVTGTLSLTNGKVTLGANTLTLTNAISGASSANYIVTSGAGLLKRLAVGNSATAYPIGNSASSYTPLTITNTGTVVDIAAASSATITNAVANAAKVVTLQWNVNAGGAGAVADITYNWNAANEGASYNRNAASDLGVYTTGPYVISSLGTPGTTSVSKAGLSLASGNNVMVIGNTNAVYIPPVIAWDVSTLLGGAGNYGTSPYAATTLATNITSPGNGLIRGTGVTQTGTAATRGWGGTGWTALSSAAGITANTFITFSVKPGNGFSTSLLAINPFNYRTSSTGPPSLLIQYKINGGSFVDIGSVITLTLNTSTGAIPSIDLSGVAALQNIQSNSTVTFRLVPYGASNASGTFYIYDVSASVASDLSVNGSVSSCSATSATPAVNAPCTGSTTVSGTSSEANGTVVEVYVNGTFTSPSTTAIVTSGNWTATVAALSSGSSITAYATAPGKCVSAVSAAVIVSSGWVGGSGNWNVATNWCPNSIPLSGDNIVISSGNPQLDIDFSLTGTLTISGSGALTVLPGKTFDVALGGSANFGGKAVTFRSDATGTASLGKVMGNLSGATNVTVERFIPNSSGYRAWRLLSIPTLGSQTINAAWQEGNTPLGNNKPNFGTQITGPGGTGAGFDGAASGNAASMLSWNGAGGWANIPNTTGEISADPYRAYFLFVRGERTKGVQGTNANTSATTLETNGTVYTGTQTVPIPDGENKFSLIPNLYPSAIKFSTLTRINVDDTYYIWDSKITSNGTLTGKYQTFTGANYYAATGGSYPAPNVTNDTIESGQAFLVHTTATVGTHSIAMHESDKIHVTNANLGLRPATPAALVKIHTRLYTVSGSTREMADANAVVFDNKYSGEVDSHDAAKLNNPGENFAILTGTKSLAVEARPVIGEEDIISFKMWNLHQQAYQLEFAPANLNFNGLTATLEDAYLRTSIPVSLEAATAVNFTVDTNTGSSAANRFRIVFKRTAPVVIVDAKPAYVISPNPTEGSNVNLKFINKPAGRYMIRLVSNAGQAIFTSTAIHAGGNSTQVLNLPEGITKGTYQAEIIAPDKTRATLSLFVSGK